MAGWSTPATWTPSPLTAAQLNTQLRDQLNALNGFAVKTADESVTSSAALQNDNHLAYSIAATGTYIFDVCLFALTAANAAGDIQVGFSFPSGTLHFGMDGLDATLASGVSGTGITAANLSATSGVTSANFGLSTTAVMACVHGILIASGTGSLQLVWAQAASNANATTVKAGSHMTVRQVA